jgi:hypothetical protein
MKNAATRVAPRAASVSGSSNNSKCSLRNSKPRAQAATNHIDDTALGRIWKSPRDRSRCVEASLRSFNGFDFVEIRALQLDHCGRMVPTGQRLTISVKQLGKFSQMIGNCYRRASAMGLTPVSS